MTQDELVANIERDIKQEGSAHVPIGIIREALSVEAHAPTTLEATLEEFAGNHGWSVRNDDAVPTHRIIFSHASGVAEC